MIRLSREYPCVLLTLSIFLAPVHAVQYVLTDLGSLGGSINRASDINAQGQVAGYCEVNRYSWHAFLYENGHMQDLSAGDMVFSQAYGINNSGHIVGRWEGHAFLYSNGVMQNLLGTGYVSSVARDINDSGQVVGGYTVAGELSHAFLYSDGIMHDLGTFTGMSAVAHAVNNSGQVVGSCNLVSPYTIVFPEPYARAFIYEQGAMRDLGTLGGAYAAAHDINDAGQIVGQSTVSGDDWTSRAFVYENGVMIDLGTLGGNSGAWGINNLGQIVGSFDSPSGPRAFLYSDGSMTDLNTFLPADSGWTLAYAAAINDAGQIVGMGRNEFGRERPFLLTPLPEPSSMLLITIAAVGVMRKKRLCVSLSS